MARKRNNNMDVNLHPGPATAALESAIQVMEEFEATEQMNREPYSQKRKGFPDRYDTSSSVESALFGFPRIGWQTGEHQSQHQAIKKQMLGQVREQLNLHHSPHNRHSNYPYGRHSGLVRCLYFASDLSETAGIEENHPVTMDGEDGNEDIVVMAD